MRYYCWFCQKSVTSKLPDCHKAKDIKAEEKVFSPLPEANIVNGLLPVLTTNGSLDNLRDRLSGSHLKDDEGEI